MNVFHKVTLQSLKQNKTRTIVTIIGILLSVSMICAVTTLTASTQDYALRSAIYTYGDWHGSETDTDYAAYEEIAASGLIEQAIYLQQIGHARLQGITNEYKPYLYVVGASEGAEKILPVHITSGSYPASSNELLLPENLASNGGVYYAIGDTITLRLGTRTFDGKEVKPQAPIYVYNEAGEEQVLAETLESQETRTYKVVGFYDRFPGLIDDFSSAGYMAVTIADAVLPAHASYDVYYKMKNAKDIYEFMESNNDSGRLNTEVLRCLGLSRYDNFSSTCRNCDCLDYVRFGFLNLQCIFHFCIRADQTIRTSFLCWRHQTSDS